MPLRNYKMKIELIEPGKFYHMYNRGINRTDIFIEKGNYNYFLQLYQKYIEPIAETYAWCLMRNHFHVMVYLKEEKEINVAQLSYNTVEKPRQINASRQFAHLFNAYCQSFNKKYKRTGSLFEKPYERKHINSDVYFTRLIYYIHNNPVHHGFVERMHDYEWSSYNTVLSLKPTKLKRKEIINTFGTLDNFIYFHQNNQGLDDISELLIDY